MKNQTGFTLIEALVAGIISVIIPGVVIALLSVNNSELAYNSTRARLSQISSAASENIRATATSADRVYHSAEVTPPNCPAPPALVGGGVYQSPIDSVTFCDTNGIVTKSYRIYRISPNIGRLDERFGNGTWQPFVVGSDTVKVDLNISSFEPKSGGLFGVGLDAQFIFFNFHYNMKVAGVTATLPMQTESFVCRNSVGRAW